MHPAQGLTERIPLVFTAHSAETLYLREKICAFVIDQGAVPVNPFMALGYFLYGMVDKDRVRLANNNLIARCDELWLFIAEGETVADGVEVEIGLAKDLGLPIRRFEVDHYGDRVAEVGMGSAC
jgi:hypothetical protein